MNRNEFKLWLENNTSYTKRVVGNLVSRAMRADKILPIDNEGFYQSRLEVQDEYKVINVSCRSQIKKAVSLYLEYSKQSKAIK